MPSCNFFSDPASGTAVDWAKEAMGIKYSYLLELRPRLSLDSRIANFRAFFLDEEQLVPMAEETWEGVKVVAERIIQDGSFQNVT